MTALVNGIDEIDFLALAVGNKFNQKNSSHSVWISAWWISMEKILAIHIQVHDARTHDMVLYGKLWSVIQFLRLHFSQSIVTKVFSHSGAGVQTYNTYFVSCCRLLFFFYFCSILFYFRFSVCVEFYYYFPKEISHKVDKEKKITIPIKPDIYQHFERIEYHETRKQIYILLNYNQHVEMNDFDAAVYAMKTICEFSTWETIDTRHK